MNDWAPLLSAVEYSATIEAAGARDAVTHESVDVARVTWQTGVQEIICLFSRHLGGDWFPTWIGEKGSAVPLPKGFKAPVHALLAIDRAWDSR